MEVTDHLAGLRSVLVRVVRTSTDEANRRERPRYKFKASVTVINAQGRSIEATLIDASEGGAAIETAAEIAIGEPGSLKFEQLQRAVPFIVRYRGDRRISVEFSDDAQMREEFLELVPCQDPSF